MKLVIFGLTVSSSWGNGHATRIQPLAFSKELLPVGSRINPSFARRRS